MSFQFPHFHAYPGAMVILFIHFLATLARLFGPGGVRSVVAESLILWLAGPGTLIGIVRNPQAGELLTMRSTKVPFACTNPTKCATVVWISVVLSVWRSGRVAECCGLENR
jgi:hypothetical protein